MPYQPTIVYAESTPNPECMKFVANRLIIEPNRIVEYYSETESAGSPLGIELFKQGFVKSLFFNNNFITITRNDQADWNKITTPLREFIQDYLSQGLPVIESYPQPQSQETSVNAPSLQEDAGKTSIEDSIIQILDEYIRPAVEQDGGAISFHSYYEGIVKVSLKGSCSGCPSASITLKAGIENLLKKMVPEVKEVMAEEI